MCRSSRVQSTCRSLIFLVAGFVVLVGLTACGSDESPDPEAAKAASATGELAGTSLAKVVAQLRIVLAADPTLTVAQALARTDASLSEAGDAIHDMLALKGLGLSDMMFLFSEGAASRLPPVPGVTIERNTPPKYEREHKDEDRTAIMRGYAHRAVIRAMLVDEGPPKPFRTLFMGDKRPPSNLLDSRGNIVVPSVEGARYSAFFAWISDSPVASATRNALMDDLGFGPS